MTVYCCIFPPFSVGSGSEQKEEFGGDCAHGSTIMQTAHILLLTTLDGIQVGQSAVSYLE